MVGSSNVVNRTDGLDGSAIGPMIMLNVPCCWYTWLATQNSAVIHLQITGIQSGAGDSVVRWLAPPGFMV